MLSGAYQELIGSTQENSLDRDKRASCTWFLNDGVAGVGYFLALRFVWILVL